MPRLDRLYCSCYSKEFLGMESEPMLTPRENSPLPEALRIEPTMLHHAGQGAQHNTLPTELFWPHPHHHRYCFEGSIEESASGSF